MLAGTEYGVILYSVPTSRLKTEWTFECRCVIGGEVVAIAIDNCQRHRLNTVWKMRPCNFPTSRLSPLHHFRRHCAGISGVIFSSLPSYYDEHTDNRYTLMITEYLFS